MGKFKCVDGPPLGPRGPGFGQPWFKRKPSFIQRPTLPRCSGRDTSVTRLGPNRPRPSATPFPAVSRPVTVRREVWKKKKSMCTRYCCWCCRRSRWSGMRRRLPRRSCWRRRRRSAFAWATVWRPKRSVYATSPPGSGRRALANRVAWGRSRAGGRSDENRRTEAAAAAAVPDGGANDFRNEGGLRGRRTVAGVRSEIHK